MADFDGLKALLVEDEGMVALLIEEMLTDLGVEIVASVARLADACELARTATIDFALLDVNLGSEFIFPAARLLRERQVPFMFSTGYGSKGANDEFSDVPAIAKPFNIGQLEEKLRTLLGSL
jgi:DNA-binding response OmpR family regulator